MAELKQWAVDLIVTTEHNYTVLARTAEEAVSLAEDLLDDGEDGDISATYIESADAVSANDVVDALDLEDEYIVEFDEGS